ncbi:T9SS type A sorting domain-containing protein [Litoribaculum gwangyangense]|uniref:Secretion system C-terminal sorting domain-containing protein n=1 Tax=Litoribaculum gwangyangense TaxID=1130722 RepID=A0ABP9CH32_9FLAO
MNKIILLFFVLAITIGYSQIAPIDFEPTGNGASWTWVTFEPPLNETVEFTVVNNPSTTGINSSANVGKIDISFATGANWGSAGVESTHGADIGTFSITSGNSYVTMQVYQEGFTAPIALKLANATNAALPEVTSLFPVTTANVWQEVYFDLSAWIGNPNNPVDQIIFYPSYAPRGTGHVVYFDNISFGSQPAPSCSDGIQNGTETGIDCGGTCPNVCPPPPAPTVSAPTPIPAVADVLYIYSEAYTNLANNIALINTSSWATTPPSNYSGPSSNYAIPSVIPTDNVRLFNNLNNAFIQFNTTNITDYKYFHIDVWSANATFLRVGLQDLTAAVEGSQNFTITQNQWNSIEIDLDGFGGLAGDRNEVFQLVFIGEPVGIADIYVDNIYFSKVSTLDTQEFEITGLKVYPNPSKNVWTIKTQAISINSIELYNILGKKVTSLSPNKDEATIDGSKLKSGMYFAKINTENGSASLKLVKQ